MNDDTQRLGMHFFVAGLAMLVVGVAMLVIKISAAGLVLYLVGISMVLAGTVVGGVDAMGDEDRAQDSD